MRRVKGRRNLHRRTLLGRTRVYIVRPPLSISLYPLTLILTPAHHLPLATVLARGFPDGIESRRGFLCTATATTTVTATATFGPRIGW